jgi:di/tricarboxylate transporter
MEIFILFGGVGIPLFLFYLYLNYKGRKDELKENKKIIKKRIHSRKKRTCKNREFRRIYRLLKLRFLTENKV